MKNTLKASLLLAGLLLLSGCISHSLGMHFTTTEQLNPDSEWQSLPVQVKVIQMRNADAFMSADFDDLWKAPKDALGDSFIKETDYMLLPNTERSISLVADSRTRYLGFVAIFRTHTGTSWRVLKRLPQVYFMYPHFSINLTGHTISVK